MEALRRTIMRGGTSKAIFIGSTRSTALATPILGMVAPPSAYVGHPDGVPVAAEDVDLVARLVFMQISRKTYAGTSTVCTGVAAEAMPETALART